GDTDWVYPTLSNGTNISGNPIGYRRRNGYVEFCGRVIFTALGVVFTMPPGLRIALPGDHVFDIDQGAQAGLNVTADGRLNLVRMGVSGGGASFAFLRYPAAMS